jgi:Exopolysaccharide synthesis, ExoD
MLRYLEKVTHPRWAIPHEATKRVVGVAVLMLSIALVAIPIPLGNVLPALACHDLAGLSRGRRITALNRTTDCYHRADGRNGCSLGDYRRRKMDDRPLADPSRSAGAGSRIPIVPLSAGR